MMGDHDNCQCLHCFLQSAVEVWAGQTGRLHPDDTVNASHEEVAGGVGALIADLMSQSPDNDTAAEFLREVMASAAAAYPAYRMHYLKYQEEDQLRTILDDAVPPKGKLN